MTRGGRVITNALSWEGWIPIYYAAYHNYTSSIGVLLENRADITISVFLTSYHHSIPGEGWIGWLQPKTGELCLNN